MRSTQLPGSAEPTRFSRRQVAADGAAAALVREEFSRWLRRSTGMGETQLCDVVLAVNEALANAAEFAYLQHLHSGTVDLDAVLDGSQLFVTVADYGQWRPADPDRHERCRGRGLPLMRTLADVVTITTSAVGSTVCLRFDNVALACPAEVMV